MTTDKPEGCTSEICFCFMIENTDYYCDGTRHVCKGPFCCMEDDPDDDSDYQYDLAKDRRMGIL